MRHLTKIVTTLALLTFGCLPVFSQSQPQPVTPIWPTSVATSQMLETAGNFAASKTTASISISATTIPVLNSTVFPVDSIVVIDNEIIQICGASGNILTVCSGGRGFDNTVAANHSANASVSGFWTAYHHNRLAAEITSIETQLGAGMSNVALASHTHSFNQITGTIQVSQLPTGIPLTNIGDGSITSTQLGYLSGVTANIQAQLNLLNAAVPPNVSTSGPGFVKQASNGGPLSVVGIQLGDLPAIPYSTLTGAPAFSGGTLTADISGNSATATRIASTPVLCPGGQAPVGILPNGDATGCQAVSGGGLADPTTTRGDILYRAPGGLSRLPLGSGGAVLYSNGTDPTYATIASILGYTPESTTNKGASNGYAPLDGSAKIPVSNLPTGASLTWSGLWTFSGAPAFTGIAPASGTGVMLVSGTGASSVLGPPSDGVWCFNFLSSVPSWTNSCGTGGGGGLTDPTSNRGDIFYRNASGPSRLALGTSGAVLSSNGTDAVYASIPSILGYTPADAASKGAANGVAPLDGSSKVPAANLPVGTSSGTVAAGDDSRITGALQSSAIGSTVQSYSANLDAWSGVTPGSKQDSSFTQPWTGAAQRTVLKKLAEFISVKDFGAKGDTVTVQDCGISISTSALSCTTAHFSSADVGKTIAVEGAGPSDGHGNASLMTTITAFTDSTHVTLAASAVSTVSNALTFWGTDDTQHFSDALAFVNSSGGGKVYVPAGSYTINTNAIVVPSNTEIYGDGISTVFPVAKSMVFTSPNPAKMAGAGLFECLSCADVNIHDMYIKGSNVTIDGLSLTGRQRAVSLGYDSGSKGPDRITIQHLRVDGIQDENLYVQSAFATKISFLNNTIYNARFDALDFNLVANEASEPYTGVDFLVKGNIVEGAANCFEGPGTWAVIDSNIFNNCRSNGAIIGSGSTYKNRIRIINNTFRGQNDVLSVGLNIAGAAGEYINNDISGFGNTGIQYSCGSGVQAGSNLFSQNHIHNNGMFSGGYGADVVIASQCPTSGPTQFVGNNLYQEGGTTKGFQVNSGTTLGVVIAMNQVYGYTSPISDPNGNSTSYANNFTQSNTASGLGIGMVSGTPAGTVEVNNNSGAGNTKVVVTSTTGQGTTPYFLSRDSNLNTLADGFFQSSGSSSYWEVKDPNGSGSNSRIVSGNGFSGFGSWWNGPSIWFANGVEACRLTPAGNLGCGTTTPAGKFSVGSGSPFSVSNTGVITAGIWNGTALTTSYLPGTGNGTKVVTSTTATQTPGVLVGIDSNSNHVPTTAVSSEVAGEFNTPMALNSANGGTCTTDGTGDCTNAIKACLATGTKTCRMPPGKYKFDNSAGTTTITGFHGKWIFDPQASIVLTTANQNFIKFVAADATPTLFDGVNMVWPSPSTSRLGIGFEISGYSDTTIRGLKATYGPGASVWVSGGTRISIEHSYVTGSGTPGNGTNGADGFHLASCKDCRLNDLHATNTGDDCFAWTNARNYAYATGGIATQLYGTNCSANGLRLEAQRNIQAYDLHIDGTAGDGIVVDTGSFGSASVQPWDAPTDIVISNFQVNNAGTYNPKSSALGYGLHAYGSGVGSVSFLNGSVTKSRSNGVGTDVDTKEITIRNVNFSGNGGACVNMLGKDVTIENTKCDHNAGKGFVLNNTGITHLSSLVSVDDNADSKLGSPHRAFEVAGAGATVSGGHLAIIDSNGYLDPDTLSISGGTSYTNTAANTITVGGCTVAPVVKFWTDGNGVPAVIKAESLGQGCSGTPTFTVNGGGTGATVTGYFSTSLQGVDLAVSNPGSYTVAPNATVSITSGACYGFQPVLSTSLSGSNLTASFLVPATKCLAGTTFSVALSGGTGSGGVITLTPHGAPTYPTNNIFYENGLAAGSTLSLPTFQLAAGSPSITADSSLAFAASTACTTSNCSAQQVIDASGNAAGITAASTTVNSPAGTQNVYNITGPSNFSSFTGPFFGISHILGGTDYTKTAGNGNNWGLSASAAFVNVPAGVNRGGAGFSALVLGSDTASAFNYQSSGASTALIRGETRQSITGAGTWGFTFLRNNCDRSYLNAGAVCYPFSWSENEDDATNFAAGSGVGRNLHLTFAGTYNSQTDEFIGLQSLSGTFGGNPYIPRKVGINIYAGAAQQGIQIGPTIIGNSQPSAGIYPFGFDAYGNSQQAELTADASGALVAIASNNTGISSMTFTSNGTGASYPTNGTCTVGAPFTGGGNGYSFNGTLTITGGVPTSLIQINNPGVSFGSVVTTATLSGPSCSGIVNVTSTIAANPRPMFYCQNAANLTKSCYADGVGNMASTGLFFDTKQFTLTSPSTSGTWTTAQYLGHIDVNPTAGALTMTTPTASQLIGAISANGLPNNLLQHYDTSITNKSATNPLIVAPGSGVTFSGMTTFVIPPASGAVLESYVSNIGSPAISVSVRILGKTTSTHSIVDGGADPTGTVDSRAAIQATLNTFKDVFCPAGTYIIQPTGSSPTIGLTIPAGTHFYGPDSGQCTLKVANSAGAYDHLLYQGTDCSGCTLEHFTIDGNVANNSLSGTSESTSHPRHEIAIFGGNHLSFNDIVVKNSTSRNSIWLVPNSGTMDDIRISNVRGINMGDDPNHVAHDSSFLYWIAATNVSVTDSVCEAASINAPGANTCIEDHGSFVTIKGNKSVNYNQGIVLAGINTSALQGTVISGNVIKGAIYCMPIGSAQYSTHTSGYGIDGAVIDHNNCTVNQLLYTTSTSGVVDATTPQGITFQNYSNNLPIRGLSIDHNTITFDTETSFRQLGSNSTAIGGILSPTGTSLENVSIHDNQIFNAPLSAIRLSNWNHHGLKIYRNTVRDANSLVTTDYVAAGKFTSIVVASNVATMTLGLVPPSWVGQVAITGSATSKLNGVYQVQSVGVGCTPASQCLTFNTSGVSNGTYSDPTHVYAAPAIDGYRAPIVVAGNTLEDLDISANSIIDDQTVSTLANAIQVSSGSASAGSVTIAGNVLDVVDSTHTSWLSPWTCDTNSACLVQQVVPSNLAFTPSGYAKVGSTVTTYSGTSSTNWYTPATGSGWNTAPYSFLNSYTYTYANSPVAVNVKVALQNCDASTNNVVFNLPDLATINQGYVLTFTKVDSTTNTCTINPNGSNTIGGKSSIVLSSKGQSITVSSNSSTIGMWGITSYGTNATQINGATQGKVAVSYSATPTYDASLGNNFTMTLTGNVTSSTLVKAVTDEILIFEDCQDATGSRTKVWPTGFSEAVAISAAPNSCTRQTFRWDGSAAHLLSVPVITGAADSITLKGSTSGSMTIQAAASGSAVTVTGPSSSGTVALKLSGSATLTFASAILDGTCAQASGTVTVTGAAVGDPASVGVNATFPTGVNLQQGKVNSANTVTVEVCNLSGSSYTPSSAIYTATIIH